MTVPLPIRLALGVLLLGLAGCVATMPPPAAPPPPPPPPARPAAALAALSEIGAARSALDRPQVAERAPDEHARSAERLEAAQKAFDRAEYEQALALAQEGRLLADKSVKVAFLPEAIRFGAPAEEP